MSPGRNVTALSERQAANLVVARLLDFFGLRTDWQRRLWNPGTVTVLQETLEAVDLLDSGHLRPGTVTELVKTARRRAGPDLGVGSTAVRSTMEATLGMLQKSPDDRVARHQLEGLLISVEANYLTRWSAVLVDDVEALAPESASLRPGRGRARQEHAHRPQGGPGSRLHLCRGGSPAPLPPAQHGPARRQDRLGRDVGCPTYGSPARRSWPGPVGARCARQGSQRSASPRSPSANGSQDVR